MPDSAKWGEKILNISGNLSILNISSLTIHPSYKLLNLAR